MKPWPAFTEQDIDAVSAVLRSGKVNAWTGDRVKTFESAFASFLGCEHAIAVANGTVALELALQALGIEDEAEVIVPSATFVATASAVVARKAIPVVCDIDTVSRNMTPESILPCITPQTRAIIVVHLAGWPADMPGIMALADQYNLKVIEDCAQAHGASIDGQKVGTFGHINAFSFCQDKIMTTGGEGGMVTTNDQALYEKAWSYKDHGKDYQAVFHTDHPPGFRWLHHHFGTNWRMTEMQAAIGLNQLDLLPQWLETRTAHAQKLAAFFSQYAFFEVNKPPAGTVHAYYKYYITVKPELLPEGCTRDTLMAEFNAAGIPCFSGSCTEIYREQCFINADYAPKARFPVAQHLGEQSLLFLVHPTLTASDIDEQINKMQHILSKHAITKEAHA